MDSNLLSTILNFPTDNLNIASRNISIRRSNSCIPLPPRLWEPPIYSHPQIKITDIDNATRCLFLSYIEVLLCVSVDLSRFVSFETTKFLQISARQLNSSRETAFYIYKNFYHTESRSNPPPIARYSSKGNLLLSLKFTREVEKSIAIF